jgi:hypothetical protein
MKTTLLGLSLMLSTLGTQSFAAGTPACDEARMKHCESAQLSCLKNGANCTVKKENESDVKTEQQSSRRIFVDKRNF